MNHTLKFSEFNVFNTTCECTDLTVEDYSSAYTIYNLVVVIILVPLVAFFGVVGNLINAWIFSRPKMLTHSSNVYLFALSVSDFWTVLTGLVMFWLDSVRSYLPWMSYSPYIIVHTLPFSFIAQTCSVYYVVMAAVDCYINVCWSHRLPQYGTVRTAKLITIGLIVFSFLFNCLRFGMLHLNECMNGDTFMVEICATQLYHGSFTNRHSLPNQAWWSDANMAYNVYMSTVLLTILPFAVLCSLNSLIITRIRAMTQRQRWRRALLTSIAMPGHAKSLTNSNLQLSMGNGHNALTPFVSGAASTNLVPAPKTVQKTTKDEEDQASDDTVTMVMVVLLFLACNILSVIISIYETCFDTVDELLLNYMTDMSNLLMMLNSSVNLFIYLGFCDEYLKIFKSIFCGHDLSPMVTSRDADADGAEPEQTNLLIPRKAVSSPLVVKGTSDWSFPVGGNDDWSRQMSICSSRKSAAVAQDPNVPPARSSPKLTLKPFMRTGSNGSPSFSDNDCTDLFGRGASPVSQPELTARIAYPHHEQSRVLQDQSNVVHVHHHHPTGNSTTKITVQVQHNDSDPSFDDHGYMTRTQSAQQPEDADSGHSEGGTQLEEPPVGANMEPDYHHPYLPGYHEGPHRPQSGARKYTVLIELPIMNSQVSTTNQNKRAPIMLKSTRV